MLTPTKKKYVFSIYEIGLENSAVRSVDIAKAICVSRASVANMLPVLLADGLIQRNADRSILLTNAGTGYAKKLYGRYTTLYQFFKNQLKSTEENARHDAIACICNLTDENTENMIYYLLEDAVR